MNRNSKIYIAGHKGLVGSAILRNLKAKGYQNFVFSPHPEYDLKNQEQTAAFFQKEKPEYVFLAAAKVGGIVANNTYRAQFIYENLQIQNNVIHQSYLNGVKKLLFLGSSCIYPKHSPQPISEEHLLTDTLEYTNEPYAIAKIAGLKMCEAYNLQYGTNFIAAMPTNLYGLNDNFDLEKSHVLPALLRKNHLGKCLETNNFDAIRHDFARFSGEKWLKATQNQLLTELEKYGIKPGKPPQITLWGTGQPLREFLFSDDLADALIFLIEKVDFQDILKNDFDIENPEFPLAQKQVRNTHINIGTGKDISISELAALIKKITGFGGTIGWDTSKPDGTPRKLLNVSKLNKMGWKEKTSLKEGIRKVYEHYLATK